jgi:hypothetical protein
MAIKRPDIYEHNNPNLPIVDSDFVKGGIRSAVSSLTDLFALSNNLAQLKVNSTQVYVISQDRFYLLKNLNNAGNINGWAPLGTGIGGGGGSSGGTFVDDGTFVFITGNQSILDTKKFENATNLEGNPFIASDQAKFIENYIYANFSGSLNSTYNSPSGRNSVVFLNIQETGDYNINLPNSSGCLEKDTIKYIISNIKNEPININVEETVEIEPVNLTFNYPIEFNLNFYGDSIQQDIYQPPQFLNFFNSNDLDLQDAISFVFKDQYWQPLERIQNNLIPSHIHDSSEIVGIGDTNYQYVNSNITLLPNSKVAADTSEYSFTLTLPEIAVDGDFIEILDFNNTFQSYNLIVHSNDELIEGQSSDLICNVQGSHFLLIKTPSIGWKLNVLDNNYVAEAYNFNFPIKTTNINQNVFRNVQQIISGGLGEGFGYSVATNKNGNIIVFGQPYQDINNIVNAGSISIWNKDVANNTWSLRQRITGSLSESFGDSVKINEDGDVIIVGSPTYLGTGCITIYTGNIQDQWSFKQRIFGSSSLNNFGELYSVSINNNANIIAVAEPFATINNISDVGRVTLYTGNSLLGWNQKTILTGSQTVSKFGHGLDMNDNGDIIGIISPNDFSQTGSLSIYTGNSNLGWNFNQKITGIRFKSWGRSIKFNNSGNVILTSSPLASQNSGEALIYTGNLNTRWELKQTITGNYLDGYFGYHVDIDSKGETILFGGAINPNNAPTLIYTGDQIDGWKFTQLITGNPISNRSCPSVISKDGKVVVLTSPGVDTIQGEQSGYAIIHISEPIANVISTVNFEQAPTIKNIEIVDKNELANLKSQIILPLLYVNIAEVIGLPGQNPVPAPAELFNSNDSATYKIPWTNIEYYNADYVTIGSNVNNTKILNYNPTTKNIYFKETGIYNVNLRFSSYNLLDQGDFLRARLRTWSSEIPSGLSRNQPMLDVGGIPPNTNFPSAVRPYVLTAFAQGPIGTTQNGEATCAGFSTFTIKSPQYVVADFLHIGALNPSNGETVGFPVYLGPYGNLPFMFISKII